MTRLATLPSQPGKINVHEFDYKSENKSIYERNGVTIKSWPAIHAGDGAVSFALYWNGLKVVIGGDTKPNTWYIKYAKDADIAIHEAFLTPEQLVSWYGQSPQSAIAVGTVVHTPPQAFGKVMSTIKPQKPDHTVPGQLSKEMLAGEWDIKDVTANMIKEFKKKYNNIFADYPSDSPLWYRHLADRTQQKIYFRAV